MPPNAGDSSLNIESVSDLSKVGNMSTAPAEMSSGRYALLIIQACLNVLGYSLIGIVVGINLQFAFRLGPGLGASSWMNAVNLHIILCVIGYQLLMGVGILALTSESGFALNISLKHKRWLHALLLIVGSVLAIAGSFVMSLEKTTNFTNFDTVHGQTGLVAKVFTVACLFNGVASLYAYEWRSCLPPNLSKLTHILFGIVAYAMAAVSLCYGYIKNTFTNWATPEFVIVLFVLTGLFTAIVILNPFITFFSKLNNKRSD